LIFNLFIKNNPQQEKLFIMNIFESLLGSMSEKPIETKDSRIAEYEKNNNTKIVFICPDNKGTYSINKYLGTDQKLSDADGIAFIQKINSFSETQNIDLIINTTGGSLLPAQVIISSMLKHKGIITAHIPYFAMSAGTLIALAAHKINLGKNGWMGQVDPQLYGGYLPAATIKKYLTYTQGRSGFFTDVMMFFDSIGSVAFGNINDIMREIHSKRFPQVTWQMIEKVFIHGTNAHDYPLTFEKVAFVSTINDGVSKEIMDIFEGPVQNFDLPNDRNSIPIDAKKLSPMFKFFEQHAKSVKDDEPPKSDDESPKSVEEPNVITQVNS
jgi:hypothetical protein